jgi:hypothetical protein
VQSTANAGKVFMTSDTNQDLVLSTIDRRVSQVGIGRQTHDIPLLPGKEQTKLVPCVLLSHPANGFAGARGSRGIE